MKRRGLRSLPRISYSEMEEPNLDEYVFCEKCADFVYEYCSIHGPLLVVPDDVVPEKTGFPDFVPRAALTIPRVFLHIARSYIPGAGLGVFATLTLPSGVRFGPYRGRHTKDIVSSYCWQIRDSNNKRSHVVDASDANASNWMRYVNCARHWHEQNLVAYQYQGEIYYRTIKIIPRFTELLVFYGGEFAASLHINLRTYNSPKDYTQKFGGSPAFKKSKSEQNTKPADNLNVPSPLKENAGKTKSNEPGVKTKELGTAKSSNIVKNKKSNKKTDVIKKYTKYNKKLSNGHGHLSTPSLNVNSNFCKRFICDECGLIFICKNTLEFHLKQHGSKKVEEENISPVVQLTSNTQAKINDKVKLKKDCIKNSCEISNVNKSFTTHIRTHAKEKSYSCDICTKKFTLQRSLKTHIRIHTNEKPYSCNHCTSKFAYKQVLIKHERVHTGEKPYSCNHCTSKFAYKQVLIKHEREHTAEKPYSCNHCSSKFAQKPHLISHERVHTDEKPYSCNYCSSKFAHKRNLITHERVHTGEKPYSCNYCSSKFAQKPHLISHERVHTGEKPYSCNYCSSKFAHKHNLITHERVHTGEKPYSCNYCSSKFAYKQVLIEHERVHTGEKPYSCNHCTSKFAYKQVLIKHERVHTGEKPYSCNYCSSKFAQKQVLITHERVHTGEKPYSCNHCSSKFAQKPHLISHERVHTGEKPYSCNHCSSKFAQKPHLISHERVHTGEKPYSCNYCSSKFSQKNNLTTHLKTHKK